LLHATRQSASRVADKQAYVDRLGQARVVRVDATHYLHTDRPGLVAREIARFVRAPAGSRRSA
jgi:hypothetical protein